MVGRLFAVDDADKRGYVVLVLPADGSWKDKPGRMLGADARWWTVPELRSERVTVEAGRYSIWWTATGRGGCPTVRGRWCEGRT
ncbi:hypothetical protein OG741_04765 [Streptomyces sp. NBC_01410]|uniref:hypothetical protein n=1 Tax=Streptomyces sp. NBC_01410 TaxID=2903856 RepID=UPI0032482C50